MQYDRTWISTVCLRQINPKISIQGHFWKTGLIPIAKIRVLPSIFGKGQEGSLSCSTVIMAALFSVLLQGKSWQPPFPALTGLMLPFYWRKIVSGKNPHIANEVICVIIVSARKTAQKGLWRHKCQHKPKQRLKYSRADISLEFRDLIHTVPWISMKNPLIV